MQPQITTVLSLAKGTSIVTESVWDNRFKYTDQVNLMGAKISIEGRAAIIDGVDKLHGSPVVANDLRAGAALIIGGLAADGVTEIENIQFIDRGYEKVVEKIRNLGGDITRVIVPDGNELREAL
jgi:UDP-N-acetylglucosamine 1-carboxyvinyltransferase